MHRLTEFFSWSPEPEVPEDYYTVETTTDAFVVSSDTARDVERQLDQRPAPRWLTFHDVCGARHRVRSRRVYRVSESTAAQRAGIRAFWRARQREAKEDRRPWEGDD
jgi:hypothetical protein